MINIVLAIAAFVGTYVLCFTYGGDSMKNEVFGHLSWAFLFSCFAFWFAVSRLFKGSK